MQIYVFLIFFGTQEMRFFGVTIFSWHAEKVFSLKPAILFNFIACYANNLHKLIDLKKNYTNLIIQTEQFLHGLAKFCLMPQFMILNSLNFKH